MSEPNPNSVPWHKDVKTMLSIPGAVLATLGIVFMLKPGDGPNLVATAVVNSFAYPPNASPPAALGDSKAYGFVTVTITNSGNQPADGVKLIVGDRGVASIDYSNDEVANGRMRTVDFSDEVDIGRIDATKTRVVKLWTNGLGLLASGRPSLFHDKDVVPVRLTPGVRFGRPTGEWWMLVGCFVTLLLTVLTALLGRRAVDRRATKLMDFIERIDAQPQEKIDLQARVAAVAAKAAAVALRDNGATPPP